jgi:cleavage and polyadenylation specificity factor subunit 1
MQCYTELTAPTAVTYSVTLPFISAQSQNLVVAKKSLLQIFELVTISTEIDNSSATNGQTERSVDRYDSRRNDDDGLESSFLGGDAFLVRADRTTETKLVLIAEFPLSGVICGLSRIKLPSTKSGGEALLVATRVARMTLCEWDPATRSLSPISLHFYEGDEYQGAPNEAKVWEYPTYLESDPGSRCAALKFAAKYLAIVPFRQTDDADVDMDDWDEDLDGPRPPKKTSNTAAVNGIGEATGDAREAYDPSFVLRIPQLDSSLLHTRHFSFLHEYREPTIGILSSLQRPVQGRRDHFNYKVLTLDLKQKASTIIISVDGLPQDLHRVVPLKAPVGGALLVGDNELIHIDQSGKSNGVAVNQFTKELTSFALVDQAYLNLKLEHCVITELSIESGELLMVLGDGRLAIIAFSIDGRTVSGISVRIVPSENGGELLGARVRCLTKLDKNSFFAGSDLNDSHVIGWTRKPNQSSKKRSRLADASLEFEIDDLDLEDEEDDDDLYGDSTAASNAVANGTGTTIKGGPDIVFRIHDTLLSIAPVREFTSGKPSFFPGSEEERSHEGVVSQLQLAAAVGRQNAGAVAIINRLIQPKVIGRFEFPEARGFWTMSVQKPIPKSLQGDKAGATMGTDFDASTQYDKFMIVSKVDLDGYETSDVYALTPAGFEALTGTEFEPAAGFTVAAGTMSNHKRVIQVLKSEIRCYDGG